MLKSFNIFMAYLIACIFTAVCVALTYYLPQMAADVEVSSKKIIDMIMVVVACLIIFSSPLTLIFGLFAYFKKISSPYFYMLYGVFAIMVTLAFIPGLQGIKGDENSLWVPFVGVISAAACGLYILVFVNPTTLAKTSTSLI